MTQTVSHPYQGGVKKASVTKKHSPLIWEGMLGTVYARNDAGEVRYFDYDWPAARDFAQVTSCNDLRISRCKVSYQGYPREGRFALWGVR